MATLYQRNRSKFLWIQYRDHISNKLRRESTGFLASNPAHRQRARELVAEKTFLEQRRPRSASSHRWDLWVPTFFETRHATVPGTLTRKKSIWSHLSEYLLQSKILTPQQLTRQHCLDYVKWRKARGHSNSPSRRKISHNTILLELKCLSSVLQEAVRRQWVSANVCHRLDIPRELPREKSELSDDDVAFIREQIKRRMESAVTAEQKQRAEFFHISFEIAMAQGCRMSETCIPMSDIDLERMEITITGKGKKRYTPPINPSLVPLLQRLKSDGREHTYPRPRMATLLWFKFFDRLRELRPGLKNSSFHSTRVTVVSRAERGGVPEKVTMALVNHSSTTVHRVYRKIKRQELSALWGALSPLSSCSGSPESKASLKSQDCP